MQKLFHHLNKPFYIGIGMKYSKSFATLLFYQHTPIDTRFIKSLCVINIKLNTPTDVPYQDGGWCICLCM